MWVKFQSVVSVQGDGGGSVRQSVGEFESSEAKCEDVNDAFYETYLNMCQKGQLSKWSSTPRVCRAW